MHELSKSSGTSPSESFMEVVWSMVCPIWYLIECEEEVIHRRQGRRARMLAGTVIFNTALESPFLAELLHFKPRPLQISLIDIVPIQGPLYD